MQKKEATDPLGNLLDHEYDGIREYDNPCPGWWKWMFFATAVFAPLYFFYFHIGKAGITIAKDHENAVADNMRLRFADMGELAQDQSTLLQAMDNPDWLNVGRSVFEQKCKSCHAEEGRGNVGPNLTDDYYKKANVQQLTDIMDVIVNGAGNGSMPPASKTRLHPNEIVLVSAYVANLRGKNLPGREAEGEPIAPWPTAAEASDATDNPPESEGAEVAPDDATDEDQAGQDIPDTAECTPRISLYAGWVS